MFNKKQFKLRVFFSINEKLGEEFLSVNVLVLQFNGLF